MNKKAMLTLKTMLLLKKCLCNTVKLIIQAVLNHKLYANEMDNTVIVIKSVWTFVEFLFTFIVCYQFF